MATGSRYQLALIGNPLQR